MAYCLDLSSKKHRDPFDHASPFLSPPSSDSSLNDLVYQLDSKLIKQHDSLPESLSFHAQLYGAEPSPIEGYTKDQLEELTNSQGFKEFLYGVGNQTDQQISMAIKKKVMKTYNKHGILKAVQKYQYLNARSHMEDNEIRETDIYYVKKAIEAYKERHLGRSHIHKSINEEKRILKVPDPMFITRKEGEHAHSFSLDYATDVIKFCKMNVNKLGVVTGDLCHVIEQVFTEKIVCYKGSIIAASQCVVPYYGIMDGILDFNGHIKAQISPRRIANLLEPYLDASYPIEQIISLNFGRYVVKSLICDLRNTARLLSAMVYISNSEKENTTALRRWAYFTGGEQLSTDVLAGYFRTTNELLRSIIAPFEHIFTDLQNSYNPNGWDVQGFIERAGTKRWIIANSRTFSDSDLFIIDEGNGANNSMSGEKRKVKHQIQNKQDLYRSSDSNNGYQEILKEDLISYSLDTLLSMRQSMSKDKAAGKLIDQTKYGVVNDLILNNLLSSADPLPSLKENSYINRESNILSLKHSGTVSKKAQGIYIRKSASKVNMQGFKPICQDSPGSTNSNANMEQIPEEEGLAMMGSVMDGDSGWACWQILRRSLPCYKGE